MSELLFEEYTMPAADLGPENPLPVLPPMRSEPGRIRFHESIPPAEREQFHYGFVDESLPHRMQDGYNRIRKHRAFLSAVLENDILRATFLPELGGRLWSLVHKPSGRELLYVNPAFQPANLAIRNAWFCGGVEWNMGVIGHHSQTCSPLFATRLRDGQDRQILRMYEWDRTRCAPYQIDAFLPDSSPFLFVRVRLLNPHDREVPMYWWSNIAVEERGDLRVLVPAEQAISFTHQHELSKTPIHRNGGFDLTYPTNSRSSAEWFFHVPTGRRPWIAALDERGRGLVQTSTPLLKGRKLFVWGMAKGGRRWQEYLSPTGRAYIEIQAGLARTQLEYLPMPAHAEWSWLEAYGLMEADAVKVHGTDWASACGDVEARLEDALPAEKLREELARSARADRRSPDEILLAGSGWGALERRRRKLVGEPQTHNPALDFTDASLGEDQAPWLALLEDGALPYAETTESPGAYMVQPQWRELLEDAVEQGRCDHWLAWLHLGVMYYHAGKVAPAKEAWEKSLSLEPSAWAYRNLAVLEKHQGRPAEAAELWSSAWKLMPGFRQLASECCTALLEAGRATDALKMLDELPQHIARHGRLRFLEARSAVAADQLDRARRILESQLVVPDVREGEVSLSELWFTMHEKRISAEQNVPVDEELHRRVRRDFPPPAHLDFRMAGESA